LLCLTGNDYAVLCFLRLGGARPYTQWMSEQYVDGGWYEQCENDTYSGDPHADIAGIIDNHYVFHENGAYRIVCSGNLSMVNCSNDEGELTLGCRTDCRCRTLFKLLMKALEREAVEGTLDPEEWIKTFSRRTGELVAMSREKAAVAMIDKLPVVLVEIVVSYFM
jgi:hypothetical protein